MYRARSSMVVGAMIVISASLASCSSPEHSSGSALGRSESLDLADWRASMDGVLASDPENDSAAGVGSGGGSLSAEPGDADLVAACNGALRLRFEISTNGSPRDSIDVMCGAMATVRMTVPEDGTLDVSVPAASATVVDDRDARTFWYVVANPR